MVPTRDSFDLARACRMRIWWLPGAGHCGIFQFHDQFVSTRSRSSAVAPIQLTTPHTRP